MRKIVVLGCGVAGYHAARLLEEELVGRRRVQLTVVSKRAHFVFSPLLPSVASGELAPDHVISDVEDAFESRTEVIIDEVKQVDFQARELQCERRRIPFDYLVIATGTTRDIEAFEGGEALRGPDLLGDAVIIERQLAQLEESGDGPLRFAVIGGSSTGVEWAAELATALAQERGLSCQHGTLTVDLFEAGPRLLPDHSEPLAGAALTNLEKLGVTVHLNTRIEAADGEGLTPAGGERQAADFVYHCAGRVGVDLWQDVDIAVDDVRKIRVDPDLRVPTTIGVYAAGDAAAPQPGQPRSSNPQVARQQGELAARNLLASMSGRATRAFAFEDRGDFVTLGRSNAILELRGLLLEGKPAWLAYRLYYTSLMPRAFQKARLLMDWIARRIGAADGTSGRKALPEKDLPENGTKNGDEEESSSP